MRKSEIASLTLAMTFSWLFALPAISPFGYHRKNQAGFTLIELIVALLLAAIMMVGAMFIYRDFMDSWDEELSSIEIQRQGTYALAVMGNVIKNSVEFSIGDYGGGTDNKLTVTVPTTSGGAKDVDYYHDDGASPKELKEKDAMVTTTIIPDTHIEEIEVANLTFTDDTIVGRSVRIDLRLTDSYGQTADFTASVRLRNEEVE